ncbi:hypothetical protein BH23VER1_BH23VER1_20880 [soil metagenome]
MLPLTRDASVATASRLATRALALALALVSPVAADEPDSVVVFNEIHYHGPGADESDEWLELHNQMAVNIDLSGWSLDAGISYQFPAGTVIPGGGFLVVAKNPGHPSLAGVPGVLGPFGGNLSNSGEELELRSRSDRLMDRIDYGDSGDWPVAADGTGVTLAKRDRDMASQPAGNWTASAQLGGTPGATNFARAGEVIRHVLVESDAPWRFEDSGTAQPAAWTGTGFDDSAWPTGAPLFATPSGAGGGGTPVLTVTEDLVERFRAGAITGVSDGAAFPTWQDTATGDGVAQNATAGGNPTFRADATPSGQPVVRFDGNDEFRTSASPNIPGSSGFVYFAVVKANATPASGGVTDGSGAYLFDRVATVGNPLASLKAVSGGRYGLQKRFDNGSGLGGPVSTSTISTTDFQIVALRRNRAANRFELWVDGVLEASEADPGLALTPQPIVIGRHATIASGGFNGDIAELLVYRSGLSDADFDAVGAYLESAYGLDTEFGGLTPSTELSEATPTSYFRHAFNFAGDPAHTVLRLNHIVADGAAFYLNGSEIFRINLPAGAPTFGISAVADVPEPQPSGFFEIPATALAAGTNVLAVSLHTAPDDTSAIFAASLEATESPPLSSGSAALVLNEVAGAGDEPFFVEIRNSATGTIEMGGHALTVIGGAGGSFPLPAGSLAPGDLASFTEADIGFRPARGDKLALFAPSGPAVPDAQVVTNRLRGRSDAFPGEWIFPTSATPGTPNNFVFTQDVVINEIHYHPTPLPGPPLQRSDNQWVELFNRGNSPVDLTAWNFGDGIDFTFPPGTVLEAGAFLVVARNPAALLDAFPGTPVVGPFGGSLARGGERLALRDAANNPADAVQCGDGGRWPCFADGGGSSLELRDPHADNNVPESWSHSDESDRSQWQTYTYRGVASPSSVGPDNQWREFIFGLHDDGIILVDDITVTENPDGPGVAMVANGDFENGSNGWRILGNHGRSTVVPDPDSPGNNVLRLVSTGTTEHMHNHVETTLAGGRSVVNGRTYEISFRAKWLNGSNQFHTRLYFNRLPKTTLVTKPLRQGTPGTQNSTAVANAGPTFAGFSHRPAVPAPGESVTVSVRADDPDGVGALTLFYSVEGAAFVAVPMTASGGTYSAQIPGQGAAEVVQFYVGATDGAGAVSSFPAGGAGSRALFKVDDGFAATNGLHNIRIILTPADRIILHEPTNVMSNGRIGTTVIYNEREIFYDVGVRLKGSQRARNRVARIGFNIGFNKDQLFRGVHRTIAIDRSEGQVVGQIEALWDQTMTASGGIPAEFNDLIQVIAPDPAHTSPAQLQLARFGSVFLDSQFEDGSNGTVYEYELIYYPQTTAPNGLKLPEPDSVVGTPITNLGDDPENYRWNYLIKNNQEADDLSRIIALAKHFSLTGAAFNDGLGSVIDIDQWLRALAYSCISGAGDSFFSNARHNGQFYARPSDGRVLYFPHDLDFAFNVTRPIFENQELQRIASVPSRRRAYLGHLHDICTTVFNASYMKDWTDHFGALLPGQNFGAHLSYINTRSNYILGQVNNQLNPLTFTITTNGGNPFSTPSSPVTLAGDGWVDVREIRLAGSTVPLTVTWTDLNSWQLAVPLAAGPNTITLEAVNFSGEVVGTDSITVTNEGTVQLPSPTSLAVSEIHYHPPGNEPTEFIEILNTSPNVLDLTGLAFTEGIAFTFASSSTLAPGARAIVVQDEPAFAAAYGATLPVVGTFDGRLANDGETITLSLADGTDVQSFAYSDNPPWPTAPDGDGFSLVLVDPLSNPDHSLAISWRASAVAGGSPGTHDTEPYADWKARFGNPADTDDDDRDGFDTRLEYLLGGDPTIPDPSLGPAISLGPDGATVVLSIVVSALAESAHPVLESTTDLDGWGASAGAALVSNERLSGSPARDRLTFVAPLADPGTFWRFVFAP